ncbi:MAG: L,D-transpeptidase, partial [Akkermansiaceae bacterium]|nr:L,D-transpeptidase [Akkermansiaceae bacterium]
MPLLLALSCPSGSGTPVVEAVTFAAEPGEIYVPLGEAAKALGWPVQPDGADKQVRLNGSTIPTKALRRLLDGTKLVRISHLEGTGAPVIRNQSGKALNVGPAVRYFTAVVDDKRAEVSLAEQRLRCWQGKRLVLESRISSGRRGSTPTGSFR